MHRTPSAAIRSSDGVSSNESGPAPAGSPQPRSSARINTMWGGALESCGWIAIPWHPSAHPNISTRMSRSNVSKTDFNGKPPSQGEWYPKPTATRTTSRRNAARCESPSHCQRHPNRSDGKERPPGARRPGAEEVFRSIADQAAGSFSVENPLSRA